MFLKSGVCNWRNHELCDPVARFNQDTLPPQIYKYYFNFAAVVRIDSAGRIRNSHSVSQREATSRSNLAFIAGRDLNRESGWNGDSLLNINRERRGDVGAQIHPRRAIRFIRR